MTPFKVPGTGLGQAWARGTLRAFKRWGSTQYKLQTTQITAPVNTNACQLSSDFFGAHFQATSKLCLMSSLAGISPSKNAQLC